MPSVREILKQTGMTDEQINAMDAKALSALDNYGQSVEQQAQQAAAAAAKAEADRQAAIAAQQQAELAHRSNVEFYETKIVPSLTGWEAEQKKLQTDVTNAAAEAAYYKTLIEKAKENGFVPGETPAFAAPVNPGNPNQPRNPADGRYVPGPSGSPEFKGLDELRQDIGRAFGTISDIEWKYESLFGQKMPISPTQLFQEAEKQKLDPMAYAARTFNFQQREQEIAAQKQKEHDAQIAAAAQAEAKAAAEAELKKVREEYEAKLKTSAEGRGNNPDVHAAPGSSKFAEVRKATEAGARPNPLTMSDADRRAATRKAIHEEISANAEAVA